MILIINLTGVVKLKRGTIIVIASLIGVFITTVITMDVYSVVYEQQNPTITDELYLNRLGIALPGWGFDSSEIYMPLNSGVLIEYSIELNASTTLSSVGIYLIEENDWETLSMVSDPDNYTLWLETNTDKWNGEIIRSRSSIRSILTGQIELSNSGEYMILGINVFQTYTFRVIIEYRINTWFNIASITFVDIAKSAFGITIPVATVILIIDRLLNMIQKEPRNKTGKEVVKITNKKE